LKLRIKKIDDDGRMRPQMLRNRAIAENLNRVAPGAPYYNAPLYNMSFVLPPARRRQCDV
jgi:hypothetical protein